MVQHRIRERGFTLIEILIVVFIIGILSGMVALSIGDNKGESAVKKEVGLLKTALDFAAEQSVLNGEVMGLFIELKTLDDGVTKQWCYHWQRFVLQGGWIDLPEGTLTQHCMPEAMQWDLVIEGKTYSYDPNLETQPPVLVFAPSGESTPVEMAIFAKGYIGDAQRIEVDMMSNITPPDDDIEAEKNHEQ